MISGLFLGTSLLVVATPGPDSVLTAQLVLRTGRRGPAVLASVGMITAGALHATLALTGISLLLRAQPGLFTGLRWLGAAAMLVWGMKALRSAIRPEQSGRSSGAGARAAPSNRPTPVRYFLQGLLCTGGNPKVGLFLLAYLPQFVPPGVSPAQGMAVLAAVHLCLAGLWLSFLITVIHALRGRVAVRRPPGRGTSRSAQIAEALVGVVFIGFAIRLGLGV